MDNIIKKYMDEEWFEDEGCSNSIHTITIWSTIDDGKYKTIHISNEHDGECYVKIEGFNYIGYDKCDESAVIDSVIDRLRGYLDIGNVGDKYVGLMEALDARQD